MIRRAVLSWRLWFGLALAAALLALTVRGLEWSEVRQHLATADYVWLIPAAVSIFFGQVARAARWQMLFGDKPRPNLRDAFAILSIGYMLSNLLPLRLGDPVRAVLVDTRTPGDGAQALATVVVERVVDLLTILGLLALFLADPGSDLLRDATAGAIAIEGRQLAIGALGAIIAALALLALMSGLSQQVGRAVTRVARRNLGARADRLGAGVERFLAGFGVLRQPVQAARILALSVIVWLIGAAGYWLTAQSFDLGIDFGAALFAVCAAALFAAFLPPAPGYVGAFHAAVQRSLALYAGLELSAGFSYALVLHALTFAMLITMGIGGLWLLGVPATGLGAPSTAEHPTPGDAA